MSKENIIFSNSSCMWWNVYDTEALCFCWESSSLELLDVGCSFSSQGLSLRQWGTQGLSGSLNRPVFLSVSLQDGGEFTGSGWASQLTGLIHSCLGVVWRWISLDSVKLGGSAGLSCVSHESCAQVGGWQMKVYVAQCLALPIVISRLRLIICGKAWSFLPVGRAEHMTATGEQLPNLHF